MIIAQLLLRQGSNKKNTEPNYFCSKGQEDYLDSTDLCLCGWVQGHDTLRLCVHVNNTQEFSNCI